MTICNFNKKSTIHSFEIKTPSKPLYKKDCSSEPLLDGGLFTLNNDFAKYSVSELWRSEYFNGLETCDLDDLVKD